MNRLLGGSLLLCVAGSVMNSIAQQPPAQPATQIPTPSIRVNVSLVQTDVMVFDRTGHFVDGLKQDQFELRVDGQPQPLSFFEMVTAGGLEDARRWNESAAREAGEGPPPPERSVSDRGRSIFFFVDDLHLSPSSMIRAKKSLLHSIDNVVGLNDRAAIVSASGQAGFLEQLTDNREVLRSAVSRQNLTDTGILDHERPVMLESQALAIEQHNSTVFNVFVEATMRELDLDSQHRSTAEQLVLSRATGIINRSADLTRRTLDSLADLARMSAGIPGRKLVFFLSDGFMLQPQVGNVLERFRRVTAAAAQSGVVIYSVDVRGLIPDLADPSGRGLEDPTGRMSRSMGSTSFSGQDGLNGLALDTGGRFLHDQNDLDTSVAQSMDETSRYYLLGWHLNADSEPSRKRSTISVSIPGHPELVVRVRQGVLDRTLLAANNREESKKAGTAMKLPTDQLLEVIKEPAPRTLLSTSVYAACVHEVNEGWKLVTALEIPGSKISYSEEHGQKKAIVDVLGMVLNDKGYRVSSFRRRLAADPPSLDEAPPDIWFNQVDKIEPGLYQVRVAVHDVGSGQLGSSYQWIQVPPFAKDKLALSSIFLSERRAHSNAQMIPSIDLERLDLNASRRFNSSSELEFVIQIYNPARRSQTSPPELTAAVNIYRGKDLVISTPPHPVDLSGSNDSNRISYGAAMNLAGLSSGVYSFQVTVTDRVANTSAEEHTSLVLR